MPSAFRLANLTWPLTEYQLKSLDDMLGDIYQRLTEGSDGEVIVNVEFDQTDFEHEILSETHTDSTAAAAANGDILTRQGGAWARLAKATDGNILTLASGLPAWAAQGAWASVAFNAANFTGSGAQTWTLTSGDQLSYRYMAIGKTLWILFDFETTSVGGVADVDLRLALPAGFTTASVSITGNFLYIDNGAASDIGYVRISGVGQSYIQLRKRDSSNWAASANNTACIGTVMLEIQ